jgi:PAS domain S-box-containing protein
MNILELAQKLAEARELFDQAIVEHCPIPVFYADKDGRWCRTNEPMQKFLAVDNEELIGARWQKLLLPGTLRVSRREWQETVLSKPEASRLHMQFKTEDGRTPCVYTSILRLVNGGFIGFMVPVCDHPVNCPIHEFLLHNIETPPAKKNKGQK